MTQHTQGEWYVDGSQGTGFKIFPKGKGDGFQICDLYAGNNGEISYDEIEANARLIAAAPRTAAERDYLKKQLAFANETGARDFEEKKALKALSAKLLEALEDFMDIAGQAKPNCGPKLRAMIQQAQEKHATILAPAKVE